MAPAHIVVIDRDPVYLMLMDELLHDEGYRVTTTVDGETAHDLIARDQPDLVLLDVHLNRPGQGMEILEVLTTDPHTEAIPVLVCSADAGLLQRCAEHLPARGAGIIAKPFDLDGLLRTISSLLCTSSGYTYSRLA